MTSAGFAHVRLENSNMWTPKWPYGWTPKRRQAQLRRPILSVYAKGQAVGQSVCVLWVIVSICFHLSNNLRQGHFDMFRVYFL